MSRLKPGQTEPIYAAHPHRIVNDANPPHSCPTQFSSGTKVCASLGMVRSTPHADDNNDDEDGVAKRLCGLLKQAKDQMKVARQLESIADKEARRIAASPTSSESEELSAWVNLSDAKRTTKKTQDKVKEIAALLRLKLAQRGLGLVQDRVSGNINLVAMSTIPSLNGTSSTFWSSTQERGGKRADSRELKAKSGMQKLLANMIINRRESKYNPYLREGVPTTTTTRGKAASPLARSSILVYEFGLEVEHCEGEETRDTCFCNTRGWVGGTGLDCAVKREAGSSNGWYPTTSL